MSSLDEITESDLTTWISPNEIRAGTALVDAVHDLTFDNGVLTALVRDTADYTVWVGLSPSGGLLVHCECMEQQEHPSPLCPHIVAVLIKWIRFREQLGNYFSDRGEFPFPVKGVEPQPAARPRGQPAWLENTFEQRRAADLKDLREYLERLTVRYIRDIARRRGWKLKTGRKADIISQTLTYITDQDDILRAVARQDTEHIRVLRALMLLSEHGTMYPFPLLEQVARMGRPPADTRTGISQLSNDLCLWGLAVSRDTVGAYMVGENFVPRAIARYIPPLLTAPLIGTADPLPATIRLADPYFIVRASGKLMALLEKTPFPLRPPMPRPILPAVARWVASWDYDPQEVNDKILLQQSFYVKGVTLQVPPPRPHLADEAIEQLTPVVGGEAQLEFIYILLLESGIIYPGSPLTLWDTVRNQFLMRDEPGQHAVLARAYFQTTLWSVLWEVLRRDEEIQFRRLLNRTLSPDNVRADLKRFRRLLLGVLSSLPDDRWIPLEDFLRVMRSVWPTFDHSVWNPRSRWAGDSVPPVWFLSRSDDETPLDTRDSLLWDRVQGAFIRETITGPLHWLGLADLALDRQGRLTAFRLHGLSDLFWDRKEAVIPPPPTDAHQAADSLTCHDGIIEVKPAVIGPHGHALLGQIASLESADTARFIYRLDSDVTYRSFAVGQTLDEIVARWETSIPIPMPEEIRTALEQWWASYGRVCVYRDLTVIEFGDDYALQEMRAVTPLEEHLIAEISPRLIIVAKNSVEILVKALERAGYTPSVRRE